jgi:Protein of unknown function (DUF2877)
MYQLKAQSVLNNNIRIENGSIRGLENLIGLGQGLTPSGDDFITGALFGEYHSINAVRISREKIRKRLDSTTFAGKTLIYLALQGSFPTYLLFFQKELSDTLVINNLRAAVLKVSHHGSTSGLDTLAGFYWYFEYTKNMISK